MALQLPNHIPIAAQSIAALETLGRPVALPRYSLATALVLVTRDETDPCQVWASPFLRGYRHVWSAATRAGFVEALSERGGQVDVDHLFPRSWVGSAEIAIPYVRLFPVWAEINRSAGAGREKAASKRRLPKARAGIIYATELQVLKIIGHPVGTSAEPLSIFQSGR